MTSFRGYTQLTKSWGGESTLSVSDYAEEIMFGVYYNDGSTDGCIALRWYEQYGDLVPRLEIFNDAWWLMREYDFGQVLLELDMYRDENITPEEFCSILRGYGFKDIT